MAIALLVGTASVGRFQAARAATTPAPIQINGAEPGSTLLGLGGMSVATSSKLLFDYPQPQRRQILDDLFCSPMVAAHRGYCTHGTYGAALQRLKVEIGADSNAEIGAEPSVERQRGVVDCKVGWEFKLMKAARDRDPNIQIDALAWSWPGWINPSGANQDDRVFSQDTIDYLLNYLGCAKANGTPVNTLGLWNERIDPTSSQVQEWTVQLRQALDAHGFSDVQLVADDTPDNFAELAVCANPQTADATAFCNAFSIASDHYPAPGAGQEWDLQTNEFSAPGYKGTWAISDIPGASASFTFTGTSIKWIGDTQFNMGMADVYLDGQLVAHDVDLYSPLNDPTGSPPQGGHYQQVLFSQSGLTDGQHTIKIVVTGQANPAAAGTWVNIDAFAVDGPPDGSVTSGPCSVQECVDDQSGQVQYSSFLQSSTPLFASEDAPGLYDTTDGIDWYHNPQLRGDWPGASYLAQEINTNYVGIGVTGEDIYTMLSSYYDQAQFAKGGLMIADTPWAAPSTKPSFDVQSRVWTVAHTTQFTQPGTWRYVGDPFSADDTASCYLGTASCTSSAGETGSYVTLRSVTGDDYAIVAETKDATAAQPEQFCLSGGLSTGTVHVWETNANIGFENVANLTPDGSGCFSYTLDPDSLYTFTDENTGHAGTVTQNYTEQGMTLPYRDNFQSYGSSRTQPRYFEDQQGGFETGHACPAGGRPWCLQQVITTEPIEWEGRSEPYTVIGNQNWSNYEVQAHLTISTTGQSASVIGRLQRSQQDFDFSERARYQAQVTYEGNGNWNWTLYRVDAGANYVTLKSGSYSNGSAWTTLTLRMDGSNISVLLDGKVQGTVTDSTYSAGWAGLATGVQGSDPDETYDVADFDDFCVQAAGSSAKCN